MKCPYCGNPDSKVINSRSSQNEEAIRRRRECLKCTKRFTTYEQIELIPTMVIKKDDSRRPFDRTKILRGLQVACSKRNVAFEELEKIVAYVEKQVQNSIEKEITSREIGEMVLKRLKDLDEVAYIRFASVYRDFADVGEFSDEVRALLKKGKRREEVVT